MVTTVPESGVSDNADKSLEIKQKIKARIFNKQLGNNLSNNVSREHSQGPFENHTFSQNHVVNLQMVK